MEFASSVQLYSSMIVLGFALAVGYAALYAIYN